VKGSTHGRGRDVAKEQSKVQELTASRQELATTDALRLKLELAKKRCEHCGQRAWTVEHTEGEVRYLKCRGCGRTGKVAVERSSPAGQGSDG
jgi:flavoprotein